MNETFVSCKDRTYTVQQKGCAERIAPIGTLSQNGYGEDEGAHKRSMGAPDVTEKQSHRASKSIFRFYTAAFASAWKNCEKRKQPNVKSYSRRRPPFYFSFSFLLASARTQETAIRNFAVEHREPGVLAGLTDARVQWPAHRHERVLRDRPPTPAR